MKCKIVIVGAGPAGISCAIRLQKAGIPNCVIDCKAFPRKKLCGGLVTQKTYDLICGLLDDDKHLSELFSRAETTNRVSLYQKDRVLTEVETEGSFRLIDRCFFDDYLVKYYISIGGTFLVRNLTHADFSEKRLKCSDGLTISYDFLVAADGVHSYIRKAAGLKLRNTGFCLETEKADTAIREIRIFFDMIRQGYAWSFPIPNGTRLGFGNTYRKCYPYKEQFAEFLASVNAEEQSAADGISGAFVPYGGCLRKPFLGNSVAFIGDAAGFADPVYGEGLYYAFLSGKQIADSITDDPTAPVTGYKREVSKIRSQIFWGNIVKKLLFSRLFQNTIANKILKHPNFVRYYLDNQVLVCRYKYNQIAKMLFEYRKRKKHVGI